MNDLGYVQDHDLLKVPDAVLLKESRKENKKLQEENRSLNQKIKDRSMKPREYKPLRDASIKYNPWKQLFCKHTFVAHRLDKELFENEANNLYITCSLCGRQYIIDNLFDDDKPYVGKKASFYIDIQYCEGTITRIDDNAADVDTPFGNVNNISLNELKILP